MSALPDDPELARLDRDARRVGRWVIGAVGLLVLVGFAAGTAGRASFGTSRFDLQNPFDLSPYNSLDSLVARFWFFGSLGAAALVLLASRVANWRRGLRWVGVATVGLAAVLATVPIAGYPEHGPGTCQAILTGVGTYGDNDETCYDTRTTRVGDVVLLGAIGTTVIVLGSALDALATNRRREY